MKDNLKIIFSLQNREKGWRVGSSRQIMASLDMCVVNEVYMMIKGVPFFL